MTEIVQYETMDDLERLGKAMAASGYFSDARQASQAVVKILAGREMGFGPVAAMTGIHIIEGKPTVGANLMAAAVRAHPHYDYQVKTITDNECAITFLRDGIEIGESALTLKEVNARKINMAWDKQKNEWKEKYNWKTYPKNMLFARCISNGVKWFAPDVFMGTTVYTPDELSGLDDDVIEMPTITVEAPPQPGLNDDQLAADIEHAAAVVKTAAVEGDPAITLTEARKQWSTYWNKMKRRGINPGMLSNKWNAAQIMAYVDAMRSVYDAIKLDEAAAKAAGQEMDAKYYDDAADSLKTAFEAQA